MALFDDTRAAWGARKPKNAPTYVAPSRRTEFFVHYDGGTPLNLPTHADCLARVRQDQAFHMDSNGWSDIGYNGLICQHGRAIEGRGIDYSGAHCPDHNTSGYGFQFMVGGSQVPTPAAYARMARMYADCAAHSGHALAKKGHRDGFATACPGAAIYAWVKAGMPAPTTPAQEDDMQLSDKVTVTRADGKGTEDIPLSTLFNRLQFVYAEVLRQRATEAAQTAAIEALAEAKGADAAAITKAVIDKIAAVDLTLTPKES